MVPNGAVPQPPSNFSPRYRPTRIKSGSQRHTCSPEFTAARRGKRPSVHPGMNTAWPSHAQQPRSALKRKEVLTHTASWVSLKETGHKRPQTTQFGLYETPRKENSQTEGGLEVWELEWGVRSYGYSFLLG